MNLSIAQLQQQINQLSVSVGSKLGVDPSQVARFLWVHRRNTKSDVLPNESELESVLTLLKKDEIELEGVILLKSSARNYMDPKIHGRRVLVANFEKPSSFVREYLALKANATIYASVPEAFTHDAGDELLRKQEARLIREEQEIGGVQERTKLHSSPSQGMSRRERDALETTSLKDLSKGKTHIHDQSGM